MAVSARLPAIMLLAAALSLPRLGLARLGGDGDLGATEQPNRTAAAGNATQRADPMAAGAGDDAAEHASALVAGAGAAALRGLPRPNGSSSLGQASAALLEQPSGDLTDKAGALLDKASRSWQNASVNVLANAMVGVSANSYGYQWAASTTRYGNAAKSSCGGLDTAATVAGTGYYAVASSQAMQSAFLWGASCCFCGSAAPGQAEKGTAPMGCFQCGRGRFLGRSPHKEYGSTFSTEEIKFVVLDVCPGDSTGWCQHNPGDINVYGEKNHLDFCIPPHGIDNNFFVFTQEECSPELQRRMGGGIAKCNNGGN